MDEDVFGVFFCLFLVILIIGSAVFAGKHIERKSTLDAYCRAYYTTLSDYEDCLDKNFLKLELNKKLDALKPFKGGE